MNRLVVFFEGNREENAFIAECAEKYGNDWRGSHIMRYSTHWSSPGLNLIVNTTNSEGIDDIIAKHGRVSHVYGELSTDG